MLIGKELETIQHIALIVDKWAFSHEDIPQVRLDQLKETLEGKLKLNRLTNRKTSEPQRQYGSNINHIRKKSKGIGRTVLH